MDYKKFLKYIRKKHIYMYDAHARIIYNKLIMQKQIQTGGGSLKHTIKNMTSHTLNVFLQNVFSQNILNNYLI